MGVRDIGLRSLAFVSTCEFVNKGNFVLAFKDELINDLTCAAKMDVYSFKTQFGILSGPFDLLVLILFKRENTVSVVIIGGMALVVSNRLFSFNSVKPRH